MSRTSWLSPRQSVFRLLHISLKIISNQFLMPSFLSRTAAKGVCVARNFSFFIFLSNPMIFYMCAIITKHTNFTIFPNGLIVHRGGVCESWSHGGLRAEIQLFGFYLESFNFLVTQNFLIKNLKTCLLTDLSSALRKLPPMKPV